MGKGKNIIIKNEKNANIEIDEQDAKDLFEIVFDHLFGAIYSKKDYNGDEIKALLGNQKKDNDSNKFSDEIVDEFLKKANDVFTNKESITKSLESTSINNALRYTAPSFFAGIASALAIPQGQKLLSSSNPRILVTALLGALSIVASVYNHRKANEKNKSNKQFVRRKFSRRIAAEELVDKNKLIPYTFRGK